MTIISSLVRRVALWAIGAGVVFASCGAWAETFVWTGAAGDGKASTAGNWTVGGEVATDAPATGDAVELTSGSAAMTWDAGMKDVKVASWTQDGYTGTVTFETVSTAKGGFTCAEVTGNVTLNSGTWTHKANTGLTSSNYTKYNRLYVKCGGNFTLGEGATVTANALGYGTQLVKVYGLKWQDGTQGGSYGGHGGMAVATDNFTYGCYYAPEDLGNAGKWSNTLTGGGAIRFDVAGAFTHDGAISADSRGDTCGGNYSGAGGSIYINAGSISGSGTMSASAGNVNYSGAGGRIAIILTGKTGGVANDFTNYDVASLAKAVSLRGDAYSGGCGTIYCETADDTAHEGWLILKGTGTEPTNKKQNYADPFTYEYTNLHFAKITVTGNTLLRIGTGCTLNLKGTVLETSGNSGKNGLALDGGKVVVSDNPADVWNLAHRLKFYSAASDGLPPLKIVSSGLFELSGTTTIPAGLTVDGGTLKCNGTTTVSGDLNVLSGGTVTTVGGSSNSGGTKMNLVVNGNLTVAEGGTITMDGKGYVTGYSPQGTLDNGWCGSHGGYGLYQGDGSQSSTRIPYDSITEPNKGGAGGSNEGNGGGGVLKLTVSGTLTVNGTITASVGWYKYYPAAGGAVNIRAGKLVGAATGLIKANAANTNYNKAAGGGGRIAVRLTDDGSDFSGYAGKITAYGTVCDYNSSTPCGGAGTVWLKTAAQAETEGTLIIANSSSSSSSARKVGGETPLVIDSDNSELSFGDVIIGPRAKVTLAADTLLSVSGSFSNGCQFVADNGSTVRLVGTQDANLYGDTTFKSLVCTVPGKKITVEAGKTITATTLANFTGDPQSHITLAGAASASWNFNGTDATLVFNDVAIGGCQSTTDLTVQGGEDLGGNSENVVVNNIIPTTLTWTGAVDDKWTTVGNWSPSSGEARVPLAVDTVIIPVTAQTPVLTAAGTCAALTVQQGATLDLAAEELTVGGNVTVAGTLIARATQNITLGGNVVISGTFQRGNSTVILNAATAQSFVSVSRLFNLTVQSPSVTFSGAVVCDTFASTASAARQLLFADGASLAANHFSVSGTGTAPTALVPATANGHWSLAALVSDVASVAVTNCDASAGCPLYPTASVGDGNDNWNFTDTRTAWDGTTALVEGQDLLVGENVTATISSAIALNSIELRAGAKLTISAKVPVAEDVIVGANATLTWSNASTIGGNLVVRSGAKLTHAANSASIVNTLDLAIGGRGLVETGASVTAAGCGYSAGSIPGGTLSDDSAGTHGGQGNKMNTTASNNIAPYGSIVDPSSAGSGSTPSAGGGIIRLAFGGALTVDGTVSADGVRQYRMSPAIDYNYQYSSAGGSVKLVAAHLFGAGSIHASAQALSTTYQAAGGGGRVAVCLTDPTADFSEFGIANIKACGSDGTRVGGAGTVCLKAGAADDGDLVVRNVGTATPNVTTVGGAVEGTSFRNVAIIENAKLKLADNATLTVSGVWTNGATFVAGAGSTVRFVDGEDSVVYGNNTFARLAVRAEGEDVRFAAGSTQTVTELLSAEGGTTAATHLTLAGVGDASWNLVLNGARAVLTGVALGGCQSDTAITVVNGKDLGGNSDNVTFVTVEPGETIVWTGAADTAWENPANWDRARTPIATDVVQIPTADRSPSLGADATVAALSVASGATIGVSSRTLTVTGDASFLGAVTGTSEAHFVLGANATLGGTWSLTGATIDFNGTTARTLAVTTASQLPAINVSGAVTLTGDCSCESFAAAAGSSVTFETGKKLSATKFTVSGTSASPVTLTAAGVWKLVALESAVSYAAVANSDASEGLMVFAPTGTDNGGNVNWLFTDTRVTWVGGDAGDFNTAENWSGNAVPSEEDDVYIGEGTVTLALDKTQTNAVKSLSLGAGATLVVNGNLETRASVSLSSGATLEWSRHGTIGGNLVALSGSTLTHAKNDKGRLDLEISGDGLFNSGSKIDLKGRGPEYDYYKHGNNNAGGSHGGRGYHGNMPAPACYDSIVAPIDFGRPGTNNGCSPKPGGGAVSLVFGGDLTFDGEIDADGADHNNYYSGSGGAIRLKARTLRGSGNLHAHGGMSTAQSHQGAGGRISIILTEGDFAGWKGTTEAYGGWLKTGALNQTDGSAGTVFLQAAGTPGTLYIENRANTVRIAEGADGIAIGDATDFPSENRVAEVTGVDVVVGTYGTLYLLEDMTIRSLAVQGTAPRIRLNGHTLKVTKMTPKSVRTAVEKVATAGGGKIEWKIPGLMLIVR